MQRLKLGLMLAAVILSSAGISLAQQSSCTLKEAPALVGFRLGMSMPEARKNLSDASSFDAKMSAEVDGIGGRAVRISGSELKTNDDATEAIEDVYLTFVDGKLTQIKVTYNGAQQWDGSADFFVRVSEMLKLPRPSESAAARNEKYSVNCNGFTATLTYSFGVTPNITIVDSASLKIVDKRRQEKETERRDVNGPVMPRRPPN